jgi:hypothetical protein
VARTTNREPDFLAVDFKAPRKSDFALGTARDAHLLLQELEAKKQLASRKRHAENEERGGNKNLRAAAETKNQNRQHGTTTNQQRTRQITPDQNKSKVQIHRHQNNDDFNP